MKYSLVVSSFFLSTAFAAALPLQGSNLEVSNVENALSSGLPISDLQVTHPDFPGKIFTGSAESIYKEMEFMAPEFFANTTTSTSELSTKSEIIKRQSLNCSWGDRTGNWNNCIDGITYLMRLGERGAWCGAEGRQFARVSCSHNCGIFLFNKLDHHLQVLCGDIPRDVNAIGEGCNSAVGMFAGARDFDSHFIGVSHRQGC